MRTIILAAVATALMAVSASAQTGAKPAATTTTTSVQSKSTVKKTTAPRTEQSKACSAKADSQNIHGKDRKKFMSSCKKGG